MKVKIDTTKCRGIGLCEMAAPTFFEVGDDGLSHAREAEPLPEEEAAVEVAIRDCPTGALSIED